MRVEISARVFAYATLTTLLVALALSLVFGLFAYSTMREALLTREVLEQAQARATNCEVMVIQSRAKLEQVNELFETVGVRRRSQNGIGGP